VSSSEEVIRRYPWRTVSGRRQSKRRSSRYYYLLTLYLRENPPDQTSFRIAELARQFGISYQLMYTTARNYHFDSKFFLSKIPIPINIQGSENEWAWAIEQLHQDGFYLIQPLEYHSGWWGEPSFRQFEDYDNLYLKEAFNRALNRLQDAVDFGLTLDGLDVRKELEYIQERQRRLENFSAENEEPSNDSTSERTQDRST